MSATATHPVQRTPVVAGLVVLAVLAWQASEFGINKALLVVIGAGLGITLYHAAFGFTGAYKRAMTSGDISGVTAQLVMLAIAIVLFAPVLSEGAVFGHRAGGIYAPLNVSLLVGAFIFGVGMQLGGGCASGTLFTVGGGSPRMVLVLIFFCVGCFVGTLHLPWWTTLPSAGVVSLGRQFGWTQAVAIQLVALVAIYMLLRLVGGHHARTLGWGGERSWRRVLRGPWPLLLGAVMLALLNWAVLATDGGPWSVTWGFTLWAGKAAVALGFDPADSAYWYARRGALENSLFADRVSLTNLGIVAGAFIAAGLAGRLRPNFAIPPRELATAVVGGLLLGYGARLAYGCNIGAFFGGVVSGSLHGWAWLVAALAGNWVTLRLRRA